MNIIFYYYSIRHCLFGVLNSVVKLHKNYYNNTNNITNLRTKFLFLFNFFSKLSIHPNSRSWFSRFYAFFQLQLYFFFRVTFVKFFWLLPACHITIESEIFVSVFNKNLFLVNVFLALMLLFCCSCCCLLPQPLEGVLLDFYLFFCGFL